MKRPNITPGPWHLSPCAENTWNVSGFIFAKGETVETATTMTKGVENARAIAALPDLLAALESAISLLECANDHQREAGRLEYDTQTAKNALIKAGYTFDQ